MAMSSGAGELGSGVDSRPNHRSTADGPGKQRLSLGDEKCVQRSDGIGRLRMVALNPDHNEVTVTTTTGSTESSRILGLLLPGLESPGPEVDPAEAAEARIAAEIATATRIGLIAQLCGQAA